MQNVLSCKMQMNPRSFIDRSRSAVGRYQKSPLHMNPTNMQVSMDFIDTSVYIIFEVSAHCTTGMGEEDQGGLPNLDPDLSKNRGGLPDPDLSKNREAFPRLSKFPRQFEESRGESRLSRLSPTCSQKSGRVEIGLDFPRIASEILKVGEASPILISIFQKSGRHHQSRSRFFKKSGRPPRSRSRPDLT